MPAMITEVGKISCEFPFGLGVIGYVVFCVICLSYLSIAKRSSVNKDGVVCLFLFCIPGSGFGLWCTCQLA